VNSLPDDARSGSVETDVLNRLALTAAGVLVGGAGGGIFCLIRPTSRLFPPVGAGALGTVLGIVTVFMTLGRRVAYHEDIRPHSRKAWWSPLTSLAPVYES
jgi:hypothetical protein